MEIRADNLDSPVVLRLLEEHLTELARHSPPDSMHALGPSALRAPDVTFWSAWEGEELLGCGALKEIGAHHGEVKSMRTASRHLRKGVAAMLLKHIIQEALRRGYRQLSLETGAAEAFAPAHRLYTRFGFVECGPFAAYVADPYSVFMMRNLAPGAAALTPIDRQSDL